MTPPVVEVPGVGEPPWKGKLTRGMLEVIIGGLEVPGQALSKRIAVELLKKMGPDEVLE